MKNLFFALTLICVSVAIGDTTPKIVIESPSQVTIDGTPTGSIVDALANGAPRPEMLDAVIAWESEATAKLTSAQSAGASALAAEKSRVAEILAAALAEELKTGDGPVANRIRQLQAAITTP